MEPSNFPIPQQLLVPFILAARMGWQQTKKRGAVLVELDEQLNLSEAGQLHGVYETDGPWPTPEVEQAIASYDPETEVMLVVFVGDRMFICRIRATLMLGTPPAASGNGNGHITPSA